MMLLLNLNSKQDESDSLMAILLFLLLPVVLLLFKSL